MKTIIGLLVLLAGSVISVYPVNAVSASGVADQKFKIIQTREPSVRPLIGESLPSTGIVRMVINVDASGTLADWMLIESEHSRFADAAVEAVKEWKYTPAVERGEPIGVRTELVFNFEMSGQVVSMSYADTVAMLMQRFSGVHQYVFRGGQLDSVPQPVVMVSPQPVAFLSGANQQGVLVDFYIDETGRPRMATADSRGNGQMAISALIAIEQWRFTPPRYKGHPVAVRASQWFDFSKAGLAAK